MELKNKIVNIFETGQWSQTKPDVTLILTLPPSANRIWRIYRGRAAKSSTYLAWLSETCSAIKNQGYMTMLKHYAMRMVLPEQRIDPDNLIKPTQDGIALAGIIVNDKYLRHFVLDVDPKHVQGLMTVHLWNILETVKVSKKKTTRINARNATRGLMVDDRDLK